MIVALAVILILAAVALPNVTGFLDQKRIDATVTQLATVRDALYAPGNTCVPISFHSCITNTNAGRLSELDSVIVSGNVYSDDSCGGTFNGGERNRWITNGPFMTYNSDHFSGMMTPIGMAEDTLTRVPNSANPGFLRINFLNNVSLADADLLDKTVEGGNGYNTGTVQWTPQLGTNGIVTLYYFVTINGDC